MTQIGEVLVEKTETINARRLEYNVIDFKGMSSPLRQGWTSWRADASNLERPIEKQIALYICYVKLFANDVLVMSANRGIKISVFI